VYKCLKNAVGLQETARNFKRNGTALLALNQEVHAICRFEIGRSGLQCTAAHLKHRALQSTLETAMTE
jgi:hypothetical protein